MTETRCIPVEEIHRALELPDSDPRRAHVRECPRCRALADEFRAFTEASVAGVEEWRLAAAESSLAAALERELAGLPGGAAESEPVAARRAAPAPPAPWWQSLFAPAWKPALAIAGVIVVAAFALWPRLDERPGEPALRGGEASTVALVAATRNANGIEARWQPIAGVDAYEVRLLSPELEELARFEAAGTSLALASDRLPPAARAGTVLLRVVALRDGDEVAFSELHTLGRP